MERVALTVGVALACVLAGGGLLWGWRSRIRRQAWIPALPSVPADLDLDAPLTPPLTGVYVATTVSGHWQERIAAQGLGRPGPATAAVYPRGVLVGRPGATDLFIPAADLIEARTARGIAGKVMGTADGIVLLIWDLGGVAVDTGLRADDFVVQPAWLTAARGLAADRGDPGVAATDPIDPPTVKGPS